MKKSVVLVIAVIYLLAIVIVGFMGIRMKVYNEVVYIDEIVCTTDGYKPCSADNKDDKDYKYNVGLIAEGFNGYIQKTYTDGLSVQLKCEFLPRNANAFQNGKPFEYIYEENESKYTVELSGDGTLIVRFKDAGTCDVTVKSQDGRGKTLKVRIEALGGWNSYF